MSDSPEPRRDIAGEAGAGREGDGGLDISVNDEAGVLNADVAGDGDCAGEGDRVGIWMQGKWHVQVAGSNADDDDSNGEGTAIVGVGVVGESGPKDEDEEVSALWLSEVRYPSADGRFSRVPLFVCGAAPVEFLCALWYAPAPISPAGVKTDSLLLSCAGVDMVCGMNEDEGEGKGEAVAYPTSQPPIRTRARIQINSRAQCTASATAQHGSTRLPLTLALRNGSRRHGPPCEAYTLKPALGQSGRGAIRV